MRTPGEELARRPRAERQAEAAVQQLQATLDATDDGIAVIGLDNHLLRFNQRLLDLWRIPREQLEADGKDGLIAHVLAQLADPAAFWTPIQSLRGDPLGQSVDLLRFHDGRVYERVSRPLVSNSRAIGRVWSFRDISDRIRAESMQSTLFRISEAAHSAPDLDALFHAIHGIIAEQLPAKNFYVALYDLASDVVTFPYWVDELDERPEPRRLSERRGLTGLVLQTGEPLLLSPDSIDDAVSQPGVGIIGSDGVDWLGIPLKTSRGVIGVLTVQNYTGDARYTERDKEFLQFVSDQVATAVERKQAEQSLRDSEERFRSVFDKSPIIVWLLGHPEGRIQEINEAGIEAFGWDREELLGHAAGELDFWMDATERDRYHALLEERGSVQNFEARMRRRGGSTFTVLHSGSLVTLGGQTFSLREGLNYAVFG